MEMHRVQFDGFYQDKNKLNDTIKDCSGISNTPESRMKNGDKNFTDFVNPLCDDSDKKLTIVDFGGGQGGHYFLINNKKNVEYHVIDFPQNFTEENIHYHENIKDIKFEPDILYSNGTIFLTTNISSIENITSFKELNPKYILLQRTILSRRGDYDHFYTYVPIQSIYYSITSIEKVKSILNNYVVEYEIPETGFFVNNCSKNIGSIQYHELLFKRKNI